jgi:alpha-D-xyloside xylohydrolase
MKQTNRFMSDMLDFDLPETERDMLWRACKPTSAIARDGAIILSVPFAAQQRALTMIPDDSKPRRVHELIVRAYGDAVVRVTAAFDGPVPGDESVMLEWDPSLKPEPLDVRSVPDGWEILDTRGTVRMRVVTADAPTKSWSSLIPPPPETFDATVLPDGKTGVPFMAWDMFFPAQVDSLPLAYVERDGKPQRALFALHAEHTEKFAGTGERFAGMNLAGHTFALENVDALGVNNRRAYKNIPFYVTSKPYGLLALTTAHLRLSLADVSTRAAQGLVEDGALDLFFIGGGTLERILYHYRQITGFPRDVPLWSYGTWMSRMSYWTAEQTSQVARKLREGGFPSDVIHLDTGWFNEDWVCDWEFSQEKYPDPAAYMREMRRNGFRISLWQRPSIGRNNHLFDEAMAKGYIAGPGKNAEGASNFSNLEYTAPIDFTNPAAVAWYQGMLRRLFEYGASVIKTDFGEDIDMSAEYHGMPASLLHNVYALLYQKAAYEVTQQSTGEGLIWARSAWVGSQRYPVHWGGDTGCTWDGMAGTLRGGLHIGLSGFAFWSYDVPGFHGVPNFMNSWPDETLFVRWTQMGVFTSHLRYHGAQPREPYEYPAIAPVLRQWWRLRYALIPYLAAQGRKATQTGLPVLRAMVFHHEDDPLCWAIDDQFYCGDSLLVAPVMSPSGVRDVYLPAGEWVDVWTGAVLRGPQLLRNVTSPLDRVPIYAVRGTRIEVYPEAVQCTDEMDLAQSQVLVFDDTYAGLSTSVVGELVGL